MQYDGWTWQRRRDTKDAQSKSLCEDTASRYVLQTKERGLRKNQTYPHLDPGLQPPELWGNRFLIFKPPSLWVMTLTLTEASGKAVVSSFPLSPHALAETANRGPRQQGRQVRCSCPPHDGASSRPWYLEETAINLTLIHSIGFCSGLSVFSPAWKPCLLSTLQDVPLL